MVAMRAAMDVLLPRQHGYLFFQFQYLFYLLAWLLCFLLTVLAVQSDPLVGDRQFWVTRPISWRNLLAGKLLFLICAISMPVLIAQLIAMLWNGLSPLRHIQVLAEEQIALAVGIAIAALFASVTRNLAHSTAMLLASVFVLACSVTLIFNCVLDVETVNAAWGSAQGLRLFLDTVPQVLVASLLLLLQYSRRATLWVIASVFVLIISVPLRNDQILWHVAARYRAHQAGVLRSSSPVTITFSFDPPYPPYHAKEGETSVWVETSAIILPVRVAGIPEGHALINERMNFTVMAPDGSTWESGWTQKGQLDRHISYEEKKNLIPADGNYHLAANIDGGFYQRTRNETVRVRASLAFRLVGPPAPVVLQQGIPSPIPNSARLYEPYLNQAYKQPVIFFFSRFPSTVMFYKGDIVPIEDNRGGGTSIWRYKTTTNAELRTQPSEDEMSMRNEEAWFEKTMDIPPIHLSNYFHQRLGK
jgi:hypothetical protein